MFTDREILLVQSSWAPVALQPDVAAEAFYARLFEVAPGVRPLFPEDMKAQGRKLIQMISVAVNNADDVEAIIPALRELGERHVGYGAVAEHYPVVGEVLLTTLAAALGEEFTEETEAAWGKVYGAVSGVMLGE